MDRLTRKSLGFYQNHLYLACEIEKNGVVWDENRARELEVELKKTELQAIKAFLLNPKTVSVLKLSGDDKQKISSMTDADELTQYFNPKSPSPKIRQQFAEIIYSEGLASAYALRELQRNGTMIFQKMTEKAVYKALDAGQAKLEDLFTDSERKLLRKKFYAFKIESTDKETVEDLYALFNIAGVKFDDPSTWTDEAAALYNFRLYKKVNKLRTTYIDGKVGRGSVSDYVFDEKIGYHIRKHVESWDFGGKLLSIGVNPLGAVTKRWKSSMHVIPWSRGGVRDIQISRFGEEGLLLHVDFSQHELRVLAAIAHETEMLKVFVDGGDIHKFVATYIWKKPEDQITESERRVAKSLSFGIVYGATPDGMADDYLNGDRALAVELLETYFERFKGIKTYIEECHKQARECGYVRSIFGDKLIIEGQNLAASLRKAQNYAIQSSASCIAGWGLWEVCKKIKKLGLRSYIFGFTHDSGDFDTHIKSLFPVIDLVKTTLEKDIERQFSILTKVDFQLGARGGSLAKLTEIHIDNGTAHFELEVVKDDTNEIFNRLAKIGYLKSKLINSAEQVIPVDELFMQKRAYSTNIGKKEIVEIYDVTIEGISMPDVQEQPCSMALGQ